MVGWVSANLLARVRHVSVESLLFQPSADLSIEDVNYTHVAQDLALLTCLLAQFSKLLIEFGETRDELVAGGDSFQRSRNQRFNLDRLERLQLRQLGRRV